jgi:hypothetical protein
VFAEDEILTEITETEAVTALTPIQDGRYGTLSRSSPQYMLVGLHRKTRWPVRKHFQLSYRNTRWLVRFTVTAFDPKHASQYGTLSSFSALYRIAGTVHCHDPHLPQGCRPVRNNLTALPSIQDGRHGA